VWRTRWLGNTRNDEGRERERERERERGILSWRSYVAKKGPHDTGEFHGRLNGKGVHSSSMEWE
jgi:hypothetical protein